MLNKNDQVNCGRMCERRPARRGCKSKCIGISGTARSVVCLKSLFYLRILRGQSWRRGTSV